MLLEKQFIKLITHPNTYHLMLFSTFHTRWLSRLCLVHGMCYAHQTVNVLLFPVNIVSEAFCVCACIKKKKKEIYQLWKRSINCLLSVHMISLLQLIPVDGEYRHTCIACITVNCCCCYISCLSWLPGVADMTILVM